MNKLEKTHRKLLTLVIGKYPQFYLVGGTAISLLYGYKVHRVSEDLDFFTQEYSPKLHREVASFVRGEAGFDFDLKEEEKRKKYLPMAVYEFKAGELIVKVDFVKDYAKLFYDPQKNGIASVEDIYYRKIMAVIGWKAGQSEVGQLLAGGRQKTKDIYDVFFLSNEAEKLSTWFPRYFGLPEYERLAAWWLGIPRQDTIMELLELVPGCDTRKVVMHLDEEIIHKLHSRYMRI